MRQGVGLAVLIAVLVQVALVAFDLSGQRPMGSLILALLSAAFFTWAVEEHFRRKRLFVFVLTALALILSATAVYIFPRVAA
jgi:hypothetical protein